MQIDDKLLSCLEDLSCLTLSNDEKSRLKSDFHKIIPYISRLSELNTDGVSERSQPFDTVNVFREDEARPSFDRDLILKNAANKNDEMFIAPKTVDA